MDPSWGNILLLCQELRNSKRNQAKSCNRTVCGGKADTRMKLASMYRRPYDNVFCIAKLWRPLRSLGPLYKVDLPDRHCKMLDWDKPLSEQPPVMDLINGRGCRTQTVLDQKCRRLRMLEMMAQRATLGGKLEILRRRHANPQRLWTWFLSGN